MYPIDVCCVDTYIFPMSKGKTMKPITIQQFFKMFPDDEACLKHLFETRYGTDPACPKCGQLGTLNRLSKMPAYTCNCGHHIHPMAGTPFERTRTPLQKWFYAMYLFTTTRNGVSAKELQRQLDVTYKTAWRIGHEIRKYMGWVDGDTPLGGTVEVDKAWLGGHRPQERRNENKSIVLGMVERGGEIITRVVNTRKEGHVVPHIIANVKRGTQVYSDESSTFAKLDREGFHHDHVNHESREYARGPVHTNTIEAFWLWLKNSIAGTHVWVSGKHLPSYLGEFEFRFNLRKNPHLMFPLLLQAFPRP